MQGPANPAADGAGEQERSAALSKRLGQAMTHITGQLSGAAGRGPVLGHGALLAQAWKPVERPGEAGPASLSTSGMSYSVLGAGGGGDSLALYRSMSSKYVPQLAAPACHVSRVFTSGAGEHSPDVAALTPAVYPPAADAVLCSARSILVAPVYLGPAAEGRPDAVLELVQSDAGVPLPQLYETLKAALGSAGLRTSLAPPTEMQAGAEPGAPLLQGPRGPASTGNGAGTDGMQSGDEDESMAALPQSDQQARSAMAAPHLTLEDLQGQFGTGLKAASRNFGICVTTLKRACRRYGISRWPRRSLAKLQRAIKDVNSMTVAAKAPGTLRADSGPEQAGADEAGQVPQGQPSSSSGGDHHAASPQGQLLDAPSRPSRRSGRGRRAPQGAGPGGTTGWQAPAPAAAQALEPAGLQQPPSQFGLSELPGSYSPHPLGPPLGPHGADAPPHAAAAFPADELAVAQGLELLRGGTGGGATQEALLRLLGMSQSLAQVQAQAQHRDPWPARAALGAQAGGYAYGGGYSAQPPGGLPWAQAPLGLAGLPPTMPPPAGFPALGQSGLPAMPFYRLGFSHAPLAQLRPLGPPPGAAKEALWQQQRAPSQYQ